MKQLTIEQIWNICDWSDCPDGVTVFERTTEDDLTICYITFDDEPGIYYRIDCLTQYDDHGNKQIFIEDFETYDGDVMSGSWEDLITLPKATFTLNTIVVKNWVVEHI